MESLDGLKIGGSKEVTLKFKVDDKVLKEATQSYLGYLVEYLVGLKLIQTLEKRGVDFLPEQEQATQLFIKNRDKSLAKLNKQVPDETKRADKLETINKHVDNICEKLLERLLETEDIAITEIGILPQDEPTGEGSADIRLKAVKKDTKEILQLVRVSLKKSEGGATPMGMKVFTSRLAKLFPELDEIAKEKYAKLDVLTKEDSRINNQVKFLSQVNAAASLLAKKPEVREKDPLFQEFLNSDIYKDLPEKEKENLKSRADNNFSRRGYWQTAFLQKEKGYTREKVAESQSIIWNHLVEQKLEDKEFTDRLKKEIKFIIGFDDVEIYAAIVEQEGLQVKHYNISPGFKDILEKIEQLQTIKITHSGKGNFSFDLMLGDKILHSFKTRPNYLTGEFQISIGSSDLK